MPEQLAHSALFANCTEQGVAGAVRNDWGGSARAGAAGWGYCCHLRFDSEREKIGMSPECPPNVTRVSRGAAKRHSDFPKMSLFAEQEERSWLIGITIKGTAAPARRGNPTQRELGGPSS